MTAARKLKPSLENRNVTAVQPVTEAKINRRILVVDDEPAIGGAYLDILGGQAKNTVPLRTSSRNLRPSVSTPANVAHPGQDGFQVTVVTTALQAIAVIEHSIRIGEPFAMGFFDILLGQGMDGVELVKKAREIDPNIFAVFVTAYSDRTVDAIQGVLGTDECANWDYLNKPFTHGEILQKARGAVSVWNLRNEKAQKDMQVAELQKRLLENERITAIATVARSVTHEFGNVLTQILGRAELGLKKPDSELRGSMELIFKASQHAADILERFKHLAKPEASSEAREKTWFSIHQPLDEAVELLSHRFKTDSIKICRVKSAKPVVYGDSTGLLQVFVNLLVNAVHAMPNSGQIDLSISEADGMTEVKIRDYGTGVDPSVLARLTEPFFTTKGAGGSGLGLAICKDIVEKEHEGRLSLRNHEVRGFEVTVQIPVADAEPKGG